MADRTPWYEPGKWLVNPAYWSEEALAQRSAARKRVRFIDCTLSEGDDCVGHQLSWTNRLELMARLHAIGVDEITLPSHTTVEEERDLVAAYRRQGLRTPLVAKGPGVTVPLGKDWREVIDAHVAIGAETISPIFKWDFEHTLSDFTSGLDKRQVAAAIGEATAYAKTRGVRVVPWVVDAMRTNPDTACLFFAAMAQAGADGVYVVDSRGNSNPLATRAFVARVRAAIGDCTMYVQHHNDLGLATANALAAVEAGADVTDASVMGIGDRGGCVSLEEAAVVFAAYGYETGIDLKGLYDLGRFAQDAFGVALAPWKAILGENWNKEEGAGHLEGDTEEMATVGVAPKIVGRSFQGVIGSKLLFGRERSSARNSDPVFLRKLVAEWGLGLDEAQFARALHRARQAVATSYGRHFITVQEFRQICEGVGGGSR